MELSISYQILNIYSEDILAIKLLIKHYIILINQNMNIYLEKKKKYKKKDITGIWMKNHIVNLEK